ncbi:diaminopimelate decarboxylase [Pseudothioglobus sp. nBUS_23]|uniref:diaminopimelate decarboxylase n=1 Tax=Pseudothioglobus sp. nBUS_23 TaxID=3395318 RepID=UPI003EBF6B5C
MNAFNFQNNCLYAESLLVKDLIKSYGSPLYIYSKSQIEFNWNLFKKSFGDHPHLICYAVKANSNIAVLNTLAKLGSGFDIVSLGELERVIAAGGNPSKCVYSGVAKNEYSIQKALEYGIYCFNVESEGELDCIDSVASSLNMTAPISIRVNPNVDANTHPYISTGLAENKFGVGADIAFSMFKKAALSENLKVCGLDYHIGSQITDVSPFIEALDRALELVEKLKTENILIDHLDIGGGIGVSYDQEETINIEDYLNSVTNRVDQIKILVEPGRSIVGNAGIFVTKVEYLKQNNLKSFAIVDGAMNDLIRPSLYQSYHQAVLIDDNSKGINDTWDIVGPVCESTDFLAKDRNLTLEKGDYIAIMTAGAYGFVLSSNYNSRPRVPEIMVSGNKHSTIRKRETIDSLYENESLFEDEID